MKKHQPGAYVEMKIKGQRHAKIEKCHTLAVDIIARGNCGREWIDRQRGAIVASVVGAILKVLHDRPRLHIHHQQLLGVAASEHLRLEMCEYVMIVKAYNLTFSPSLVNLSAVICRFWPVLTTLLTLISSRRPAW